MNASTDYRWELLRNILANFCRNNGNTSHETAESLREKALGGCEGFYQPTSITVSTIVPRSDSETIPGPVSPSVSHDMPWHTYI